jgi:hypothetical protein
MSDAAAVCHFCHEICACADRREAEHYLDHEIWKFAKEVNEDLTKAEPMPDKPGISFGKMKEIVRLRFDELEGGGVRAQGSRITLFAAITGEQHEKLRQVAFKENRNLGDVVREALNTFLQRKEAHGDIP